MRSSRVAIAVTVVALAGFSWFAAVQFPRAIHGQPDFPNYYFGGERLLSGEPAYGSFAADLTEHFGVEEYDAYPADPPATVVVLSPLSLMPYETAWVAFVVLSALLIAGVGYGVAREIGWPRLVAVAAAAVFLATSAGRFLLLRNHMESILLLLLFLGWLALRRGRNIQGGVWWGIAAALKLFPAILVIGLFAARKTKAALAMLATACVASAVGVAVVGWDSTLIYVRDILPRSEQWYGALGNYSLLSFGTALGGKSLGWGFAAIGGIALLVWYWRSDRTVDQVWVAGLAAALLISPLSWLNYLVLVIPGVMMVTDRLDLGDATGRWTAIGLIAALGFWGPIVLSTEVPSVLLSMVPTYGLVALFLVASGRRWRESPA
jgi:hypothetical protein